jgi:predicted amidohydrolase YtcJ
MNRRIAVLLATLTILAPPVFGQPQAPRMAPADAVYTNAAIYTVGPVADWAGAMAVTDGRISALGSPEQLQSFIGESTAVYDLGERMVMPGIHDTHIHPSLAGQMQRLECYFLSFELDEVVDALKGCIDDRLRGEWVRGGQWHATLFQQSDRSPREILDEIAPDNPVFLMDWSWHNGWVNSKALEIFDIDRDTPDPQGGVIARDEAGEPTGILGDAAAYSVLRRLPAYSLDQRMDALEWSLERIAQHGVTTIKEAIVTTGIAETYRELSRQDRLPMRIKTSLTWKNEFAVSHGEELALIANRAGYSTDDVDTGFAKIMLDGVPIPPVYTAAMLEPYTPSDQYPEGWRGKLIFEPAELNPDVVALDRQGLSVKIHATGDRSLRAALDAFEAAREANGDSGVIHEISHAELIHPDDIARFAELNVAAEMCPILWHPVPGLTWEAWLGPDRKLWPIKSLVEAGALVTYGSDWSVVPTPNPWPGIEAMVTRADPSGAMEGSLWPEQAIDLQTAVRIFTLNSAIANRAGDRSGSLEVGKDADFIVLDRNIFKVPITEVGDTQVLMSVVGGRMTVNKLKPGG